MVVHMYNGILLNHQKEWDNVIGSNKDGPGDYHTQFSSIQSLSRVQLFATPWTTACQASLSITNSQSPPKPMSIESVMPSNRLILCHPFLLPSIFPSIRAFSKESALCIRWNFSFNINPSNEHPVSCKYLINCSN